MIKDQVLVKQMLEMISTTIEASEYLYKSFKNCNYSNFIQVSNDIGDVINSIYSKIIDIKSQENIIINVDLACENANYSLSRIKNLFKARSKRTLDKIEFELIPILEDMYLQLYFWGSVYPDKERIHSYYNNELIPLCHNKYIDESEKSGIYKYDLSVIVLGYNKLEYTKLCVENLLKYIPDNINYELILINHGSTDNTKMYFEQIAPTKQLDILKNGGSPTASIRIVEGKYTMSISNDVIVTKNAIENMIRCIESDDNIAWVVPSTPNMCNNQTIPASYKTIEEMHQFSELNNISDPYRWEQRVRLCNPIDLKRSSTWYSSNGIGWGGYFHTPNTMVAPDEKVSLILRRKGYKLMLAKDAYCYHFGGVTRKDEIKNHKDKNGNVGAEAFYKEAREDFIDIFGIDPLSIGVEYDPILFEHLECNDSKHVDILGINCGIGSTPLKIKESIKENVHNLDVSIYNIVDEVRYIQDLKNTSEIVDYISKFEDLENVFDYNKFNYIVFESKFDICSNPVEIINILKNKLVENGILIIRTINPSFEKRLKNIEIEYVKYGNWIIFK